MKISKNILVWTGSVLVIAALFWGFTRTPQKAPVTLTPPAAPPSEIAKPAETPPPPGPSASLPDGISPAVRATGTNAPYAQRKQALLNLGYNLSSADCQFLYESLRSPIKDTDFVEAPAIKNTVMDLLRGQANLPAPYPRLLIDLFKDREQHRVTRDYALQHLVDWYAETPRLDSAQTARDEVRAVLWSALDETLPTIAGTALLGLQYLSEHEPQIEVQKLAAAALGIVTHGTEADHSRLTALQVCSRLQVAEVLPAARELAQSSHNIPLRAAAIATLGSLGQEPELKLLRDLDATQADGALQPAISSAIAHLTHRNKG